MGNKECIAMVLAGGRGTRLGALTSCMAKSAIFYGGSHRIIDFTLSNCSHSGIDVVGVLTQYLSDELHCHIGDGSAWNMPGPGRGVFTLPSEKTGGAYRGTADAVYRNIDFIERFAPEYVCVLAGDHIYRMDYAEMLDVHKKNDADVTIASVPFSSLSTASGPASSSESRRYGIISADENGRIFGFEEKTEQKPERMGSDLAPMGVYIFTWKTLRRHLAADSRRGESRNDFARDVIPAMLSAGEKLHIFRFGGYWRDVGTVESLWESSMD
ncbi:MAG: NTP transferase domain-containing protein, partial [Synergistaceae bacterium]|nr:NTP transferase domain-containing protein [Synergistaceae bacterium]